MLLLAPAALGDDANGTKARAKSEPNDDVVGDVTAPADAEVVVLGFVFVA